MAFTSLIIAAIALISVAASGNPPKPGHALLPRQLCNGTIALDQTTTQYTIKSGDTLTAIATQFNRGICDIARANNITNPNLIFTGDTITIPAQVCFPDSTSCISKTTPTATCIYGGPRFYIVMKGDTLSAIADSFNITLAALIAANVPNVPNPDAIEIGQVINVPVCPGSQCTIQPYTVAAGDIFYDLAIKFNTTYGQIMALNVGVDPGNLQVGQEVTLPSYCHPIPGWPAASG